MSVRGIYRAELLFGNAVRDSEAKSIVSSAALDLGQDGTFHLKMGRSAVSGVYETSGRFLVLHLHIVNGIDAIKAKGGDRSVLNQVYEMSRDLRTLSYVNAEPGSAAVKFVRK